MEAELSRAGAWLCVLSHGGFEVLDYSGGYSSLESMRTRTARWADGEIRQKRALWAKCNGSHSK